MLISDKTLDGISINELSPCSEKLVLATCDGCGREQKLIYANYNRSQTIHNRDGKTYCRHCASKINGLRRRGTPAYNKGIKLPSNKKGKNHPSWKGGQYISSDGYKMVYVGKQESDIGWKSYKKEHILVVEQDLKRSLNVEEVVHHLDGDKVNNQVGNLWVTDPAGHRIAHASLQDIGYLLYKDGFVGFDKEKGIYFLKGEYANFKSS